MIRVADDPPVRLELALARAPRADAALGAREVGPQLRQPRELVLELRELHLEPALVGPGVLGEDVEDQPAAVDDLDLDEVLEGLLLCRRELVVGDQQVEARLGLRGDEILRLALAHVPVRVHVPAVLPLGAHDLRAGGQREVRELGERVLRVPAVIGTGVDGDEERALDRDLELDQLASRRACRRHRGRIPAWFRGTGLAPAVLGPKSPTRARAGAMVTAVDELDDAVTWRAGSGLMKPSDAPKLSVLRMAVCISAR